jgi:hypothetical protein
MHSYELGILSDTLSILLLLVSSLSLYLQELYEEKDNRHHEFGLQRILV